MANCNADTVQFLVCPLKAGNQHASIPINTNVKIPIAMANINTFTTRLENEFNVNSSFVRMHFKVGSFLVTFYVIASQKVVYAPWTQAVQVQVWPAADVLHVSHPCL